MNDIERTERLTPDEFAARLSLLVRDGKIIQFGYENSSHFCSIITGMDEVEGSNPTLIGAFINALGNYGTEKLFGKAVKTK